MNSLPLFLVTFIPMVAWGAWLREHLLRVAQRVAGGRAALYLAAAILFPGTLLHELSHWLAAWVLGAEPGQLNVWPRARGNFVVWGFVRHRRVDFVRSSLIGLAPLLTGGLALYGLSLRAFQIVDAGPVFASGDLRKILVVVWLMMSSVDLWLWLYLIFAIANVMAPSSSDRAEWAPAILLLVVVLGLVALAGGQAFLSASASWLDVYVRWMAVLSAMTLLIDVPFWLVIKVIETVGA